MVKNAKMLLNAAFLLTATFLACLIPSYWVLLGYPGFQENWFYVWSLIACLGNILMFPAIWGYFYTMQKRCEIGMISPINSACIAIEAIVLNPMSWIVTVFLYTPIVFLFIVFFNPSNRCFSFVDLLVVLKLSLMWTR